MKSCFWFLAVFSGMPSVSFVRGSPGLGGIVVLSPARGERNARAFAANYRRRPYDDLLSSLRDFGPSCTRIPPLKGWASFYRPAGLVALFHRKQRRTLLFLT